jgi:hypothetical protein
MTGVEIVGQLLRAAPELIAILPAQSIKAGELPEGVRLPALSLRCVSRMERRRLRRARTVRQIERVAVTVRARTYREQCAVVALVGKICPGWTGDLLPARRISIMSAGVGPDMAGPGDSFEQTFDLKVSFEVLL